MIRLTRLNHAPVTLNSDLIVHIDTTPDTVITLTTGQKMVVLEPVEEVVERVIRFRRSLGIVLPARGGTEDGPPAPAGPHAEGYER